MVNDTANTVSESSCNRSLLTNRLRAHLFTMKSQAVDATQAPPSDGDDLAGPKLRPNGEDSYHTPTRPATSDPSCDLVEHQGWLSAFPYTLHSGLSPTPPYAPATASTVEPHFLPPDALLRAGFFR